MRALIISVFLALVAARVSLPYVLKHEANVRLSSIPDYEGHLEGVSLALWRGAFAFKEIEFIHKAGDMSVMIPRLDLRIDWPALFRHRLFLNVGVTSPRLGVLAQKPIDAAKKTGKKVQEAKHVVERKTGKSIPDLLANLIPFKVNRLTVHKGSVQFSPEGHDLNKEPGIEVRITDLELEVTNLTNIHRSSESVKATCVATGKVMGAQSARIDLQVDPIAKAPLFNLKFKLEQLPMVELNPVFDWQWGIRVKAGTFALYSEAAAADGQFKGYVRPFMKDLKIDHKRKRGLVQVVKETAAKVASVVLKNTDTKAIATEVPFAGKFENPDVGIWEAVIEVLRNAFIEALRPSFNPSFKET